MSNPYIHIPAETIALPCADLIKMVERELLSMQSCTYHMTEVLDVIVKSHEFGSMYTTAMLSLMPNTMNGLNQDDIYVLHGLLNQAFQYINPILKEVVNASGLNNRPIRLSYFTHTPAFLIVEVNDALPVTTAPVTSVQMEYNPWGTK